MAWWQIASIGLTSFLALAVAVSLAWYFRKFFYSDVVDAGEAPKATDATPMTREQQAQASRVFSAKVPEILAAQPAAEALPGIMSDAAESSKKPALEPLGEPTEDLEATAPTEVPMEPFLLSTSFERLRMRRLMGAGGFGRVQLVEESDCILAAWKALSKKEVERARQQNAVLSEKRVLTATKICPSPFIVGYMGCCQTRKYLYFKMEALLGGELARTYKQKNLYGSEAHARYYLACAIKGVQHLHRLWVVLRSLKPEDCVLDSTGKLKIVDFGLSKFVLMTTFTTCGTPEYLCPEIISNTGHSFPVDWWCAGVMLFELLAGDVPWPCDNPFQMYRQIMQGISKVKFPAVIPARAKDLIRRLCQHMPERRLPAQKGFEALTSHRFFQNIAWECLEAMTPPLTPGNEDQESLGDNPDELPDGFTHDFEGEGMDWSQHFGPPGAADEFPDAPHPA